MFVIVVGIASVVSLNMLVGSNNQTKGILNLVIPNRADVVLAHVANLDPVFYGSSSVSHAVAQGFWHVAPCEGKKSGW
jgi:hypothetical protein